MDIDVRTEGDLTIVKPSGRIDATALQSFSAFIIKAVADGGKKILVDFTDTEYMSSAGIRSLMEGLRCVEEVNGTFAVCSPNENMRELFDVIRLDQVVKIYNSDFEAIDQMMA